MMKTSKKMNMPTNEIDEINEITANSILSALWLASAEVETAVRAAGMIETDGEEMDVVYQVAADRWTRPSAYAMMQSLRIQGSILSQIAKQIEDRLIATGGPITEIEAIMASKEYTKIGKAYRACDPYVYGLMKMNFEEWMKK